MIYYSKRKNEHARAVFSFLFAIAHFAFYFKHWLFEGLRVSHGSLQHSQMWLCSEQNVSTDTTNRPGRKQKHLKIIVSC